MRKRDDGVVHPNKGGFHDMAPPERLVFPESAIENEEDHPGLEVLTTGTSASHEGGKTRLTLHAVVVKSTLIASVALDGIEAGSLQSLGRRASHLR